MSLSDPQEKEQIYRALTRFQQQDFSFESGRILGSMCTQPHPIAKKAYSQFLETNLGDPALFPGSIEMEQEVLTYLQQLLHAPAGAGGTVGTGGTEGNITAMWIARRLSGKKELVIPESAHFSFQKIASLMDVKLQVVPLTKEYVVDMAQLKNKISSETAAVVGIAGSTELGTIDPLPEISELCADEQVFLHVDAAFGGFIIPFLKQLNYPLPDFDFSLPGVSSISIDAHKMGYAAIPFGTLLLREKQWFDKISVASPYISVPRQAGILGTRSAAPVAGTYAVINYLGDQGYQKVMKRLMELTSYTAELITKIGLSLVIPPTLNVIGVKVKQIDTIVDLLAQKGWMVNKMPRLCSFRIVLMPQITQPVIDAFITDLKQVCKQVGEL